MSTWKTDVNKVISDVGDTFNMVSSNVQNTFGSVTNRVISEVNAFFQNGTTVVGINGSKIPEIKQAIRDYVNGIQSALGELVNFDPEIAFKGSYVASLKEYIDTIINACKAIVSNMLAFNDELSKVYAAYVAKGNATKDVISSDAETVRSSYNDYKEFNQQGPITT